MMESEPVKEYQTEQEQIKADTESSTIILNEEVKRYTKETIDSLTNGVVQLYKPKLSKVKHQLKELTDKQTVLIEQLHDENLKLAWSLNSSEMQDMFSSMKLYQIKLLNIKKDMKSLHERSTKLKKRALRLQQHKEKEVYMKNQQVKQEQDLVAKPGSSHK